MQRFFRFITDLLERKKLLLRTGTIVDATLIAAPSSTKNSTKSRDRYQGADQRPDMPTPEPERKFQWHIAMKRSQRKALDHQHPISALQEQLEQVKSKIRAKVEHPFRVIKRQFGHVKVRYRGLRKNTQQLHTLFALANLWMARGRLLKNSQSKPGVGA